MQVLLRARTTEKAVFAVGVDLALSLFAGPLGLYGQCVGLLIRRLRVRIPQWVFCKLPATCSAKPISCGDAGLILVSRRLPTRESFRSNKIRTLGVASASQSREALMVPLRYMRPGIELDAAVRVAAKLRFAASRDRSRACRINQRTNNSTQTTTQRCVPDMFPNLELHK